MNKPLSSTTFFERDINSKCSTPNSNSGLVAFPLLNPEHLIALG